MQRDVTGVVRCGVVWCGMGNVVKSGAGSAGRVWQGCSRATGAAVGGRNWHNWRLYCGTRGLHKTQWRSFVATANDDGLRSAATRAENIGVCVENKLPGVVQQNY